MDKHEKSSKLKKIDEIIQRLNQEFKKDSAIEKAKQKNSTKT